LPFKPPLGPPMPASRLLASSATPASEDTFPSSTCPPTVLPPTVLPRTVLPPSATPAITLSASSALPARPHTAIIAEAAYLSACRPRARISCHSSCARASCRNATRCFP
ncbi:unnamed protein product, partial [Closterium sp. NIES-54]